MANFGSYTILEMMKSLPYTFKLAHLECFLSEVAHKHYTELLLDNCLLFS